MVFIWKTLKDPFINAYISTHHFLNLTIESTIAGIIGGRILYILSDHHTFTGIIDMLSIWNGGLSIIGSVLSALLYALWYCSRHGINALPVLDRVVIYAPLLHAIARLGCFFAGCCFGAPCAGWWAITYTHPESTAPLCQALHPSQLYSSLIYVGIFLIMNQLFKKTDAQKGIALCTYLILSHIERFVVDFFRGDRVMLRGNIPVLSHLSVYQLMALAIIGVSCITAYCLYHRHYARHLHDPI